MISSRGCEAWLRSWVARRGAGHSVGNLRADVADFAERAVPFAPRQTCKPSACHLPASWRAPRGTQGASRGGREAWLRSWVARRGAGHSVGNLRADVADFAERAVPFAPRQTCKPSACHLPASWRAPRGTQGASRGGREAWLRSWVARRGAGHSVGNLRADVADFAERAVPFAPRQTCKPSACHLPASWRAPRGTQGASRGARKVWRRAGKTGIRSKTAPRWRR